MRAAVSAAVAIAESLSDAPNPLLVHGPTGCGKSHLIHAIARRAQSRKVLRISADEFRHLLLHAVQHHEIEAFRRRLATFDIVLLDDFPIADDMTKTQEAIAHHLLQAITTGTRIVVTFHASSTDSRTTARRLQHLFGSPTLARLSYPDAAGRLVLARRAAAERSVDLDSSAIENLARRLKTPRQIQAAIARLAMEA